MLDRVEYSSWYRGLSVDQRERVDDAITDSLIREAGIEQPGEQEPVDSRPPDLDDETDPAYQLWLDDESGLIAHPDGEDDLADGENDLDEYDPVLEADAASIADQLGEGAT